MKTILRLTIFAATLALVSCSPISKNGYMKRYAEFIAKIEAEYANYTDVDWVEKDVEQVKFAKVWYAQFQAQLTSDEKSTLIDYEYKYSYYRALSKGKGVWDALKDTYHREAERIKQDVVNELKVEAEGISDAVKSFVDDAANEIKSAIQQVEGEMNGSNQATDSEY